MRFYYLLSVLPLRFLLPLSSSGERIDKAVCPNCAAKGLNAISCLLRSDLGSWGLLDWVYTAPEEADRPMLWGSPFPSALGCPATRRESETGGLASHRTPSCSAGLLASLGSR